MAKDKGNSKKEPGSKIEKKINDKWEKDRTGFDHYCPTCKVYYPASSNAHAGH